MAGVVGADLDEAHEVAEGVYWVGLVEADSKLISNPYLILDGDEAIIVDPGSIPDFPIVMRKILEVVRPSAISTIVVAHQDADVCGNLPVIQQVIDRDDLVIVAHSICHRLIYHYGITSGLYAVDEHDCRYVTKNGRELRFVHTPYLHSPGAIMTFDLATRSLFSSDIFGSIARRTSLWADHTFPQILQRWHEQIMPANQFLRRALDQVEALEPERILPQHGVLIPKERIAEALAFLRDLPCGYDLLAEER